MLQRPRPLPCFAIGFVLLAQLFVAYATVANETGTTVEGDSGYEVAQASGESEISDEVDAEIEEIERQKAEEYETSVSPAQVGEIDLRGSEVEMDEVDEITVTANRRAESLQDAAVSVTALKGTFMEEVGLTEFSELQKYTPNLRIIPQTDSRSTSIRIRGIGSVGNNAGIDPSVGVFVNGVFQGRAGMSVQDLIDIESVEVLRGPQGTLYGKNTAAGAIKVTSRKPSYDPEAMFEFVGGNYTDIQVRFMGNLPLIDEKLATRLTGYATRRDGYETNSAPTLEGTNINDSKNWGIRSSTKWDATDELRILLVGDYARTAQNCCAADPLEYGSIPSVTPSAEFVSENIENLQGGIGIPLPEPDPNDRVVDADEIPSNFVSVGGVSLEALYDQWDYQFSWQTAYRNYQSDSLFDGDFSRLPAITWDTNVFLDQVSTELRAVSPQIGPSDFIDYVTGFYFFYSQMKTDDILQFSEKYLDCCFDLQLDPVITDGPHSNIGDNLHETTSVAGYFDTNLQISEFWGNTPDISITGGIRVGWEEKRQDVSIRSVGRLGTVLPTAISGPDQDADQTEDDTYVTGRVILRWRATDDIMTYASFATGYKSGGFNQLRTTGAENVPDNLYFGPEESKSYELGIRTTWLDRMLTFNMTGFYTDYDDFQAQIFDGLGISVENAGRFITYGFEADLTLVPVSGWITTLGIGYTKTEYKDFPFGPCVGDDLRSGGSATCQFNPDLGALAQDLTGRPLDNTPEWSITLFTTYEREFPTIDLEHLPAIDMNWFVSMDYNYQGNRFLNAALDPKLKADPINLLGFRAGFRGPEGSWELNFFINNVTDDDFYAVGFDIPTMGGLAIFQGPPRTYGGRFRINF